MRLAQPARRRAPRARRAHGRPSAAGRCRSSTRSVLDEHRACRDGRGRLRRLATSGSVRGRGPGRARPRCRGRSPTTSAGSARAGRSTRTCSTPTTPPCVDDIIVWWVDDDEFVVMPNASNTEPLVGALEAAAPARDGACTVEDVTDTRAVLAVQGPEARRRLRGGRRRTAAGVPRFAVRPVDVRRGAGLRRPGTGYTGEDGVELARARGARAGACWRRGSSAPASCPAGLGARDTLRLEAGLPAARPRARARASRRCRPASAGWCAWTRATSAAGTPLVAEQERGVARRLRGLARRRPPDPAGRVPGARSTARPSAR